MMTWTKTTIDAPENWYLPIDVRPDALQEAAATTADGAPLTGLRAPDSLRRSLREALAPAREALELGRGFVILHPGDTGWLSLPELTALYWFVGQGLGEPFAQNVQGTLLYDVRDAGQSVAEGARFSVTNADSTFHTDNSFGETVLDYVGLLCLQTARSGGVSQMVNGHAVVDLLRREHPAALETLCSPFHVDRRGGTLPGQAATAFMPVIENRDRAPSMRPGRSRPQGDGLLIRYLRTWIEVGHEKAGQPLTPGQVEALDVLDATLCRPDLRVEFELQPAEMYFLNNRWTLHSRTAFEDFEELDQRRHLVRLWLTR